MNISPVSFSGYAQVYPRSGFSDIIKYYPFKDEFIPEESSEKFCSDFTHGRTIEEPLPFTKKEFERMKHRDDKGCLSLPPDCPFTSEQFTEMNKYGHWGNPEKFEESGFMTDKLSRLNQIV